MLITDIEAGRSYRLVRPFEVRDEQTGTIRNYLLKGTIIHVSKVAIDQDRVWIAGVTAPLPYFALRHHLAD